MVSFQRTIYTFASLYIAAFFAAAMPSKSGDPCKCPHSRGRVHCKEGRNASRVDLFETVLLAGKSTAQDKFNAYWETLLQNQNSHGFANPIYTILKAEDQSYLEEMGSTSIGNIRPKGHVKITHGTGGHAKAHLKWNANAKRYTGMFQKADSCLIRVANAAAPSKMFLNPTSYGPNMAVKCFRDGLELETANLQLIWEIDGYNVIPEGAKDSCSYFKVPLSNHCGRCAKTFIFQPTMSTYSCSTFFSGGITSQCH